MSILSSPAPLSPGIAKPASLFTQLAVVVSLSACRLGGGDDLPPVLLLDFDASRHTPAAFAQAGIDFPAEIVRSVPKRQAEFLCGRIVAHEAMRHLGIESWRAQIGIGPSREPLWPHGVAGSISHARGIAAAVVAPIGRHVALGLDVEQVASGSALDAITHISVDADEQALLARAAGEHDLDERITLAFSAKESLFKAAFPAVGRYFDFDAARVTALDPNAARLTLTITASLGGGFEPGRSIDVLFARPRAGVVLTLVAL